MITSHRRQQIELAKLKHFFNLCLTKKQVSIFFADFDPLATEYWQSLPYPVQFRIERLADILDGEFELTDFDGGDDGGNSRIFSYIPNSGFKIVIRYYEDTKTFNASAKLAGVLLSFINTHETRWLSHRLDVIVNLIGNIKLNNGEYWDVIRKKEIAYNKKNGVCHENG